MYRKAGMDVEEYLDYCKDNEAFARFIGFEPFKELLKRGRIDPFITTVRVMYTGLIDQCYKLDENGIFFSLNRPDTPPQSPEEVLREDKHPAGWEVEMIKPKHFRE